MSDRAAEVEADDKLIGTVMVDTLLMRGRAREMEEGEMSESGTARERLLLPLEPLVCCCMAASSRMVRRPLHSRISFSASSALCRACLVSSSC